jgi:hypothetical protein
MKVAGRGVSLFIRAVCYVGASRRQDRVGGQILIAERDPAWRMSSHSCPLEHGNDLSSPHISLENIRREIEGSPAVTPAMHREQLGHRHPCRPLVGSRRNRVIRRPRRNTHRSIFGGLVVMSIEVGQL